MQPTSAKWFDDAIVAIERDNNSAKGVLKKDYAQSARDTQCQGELDDPSGRISRVAAEPRFKDMLVRVYDSAGR